MENIDKVRMTRILRKYLGKPVDYGQLDCNLAFLEIHEPEMYETLSGRYTTTKGGARVAKKEYGVYSILEFVNHSFKYDQIPVEFAQYGDVIIDDVSVAICLGNKSFSMHNDIFCIVNTHALFKAKCYRKVIR
ncbi:hypothetical protein PE36_00305 [Moritella sp. PE36]|uniref:DUF6950 family protein n=1 Tax=Moritella sp. PE36 TaxID=58051 RepID=UPI00015693D9|nr:hypothetical protein [Moritella sp. PE36]EDM66192.1 hypothetical protein PE36_00305 [Moritella sp. PE36]